MPIPRGRSGTSKPGSDYARYAGLGVQFGAAVVLFALGGAGLDRWAGTSPLFLLIGVALGFTGGLISLIRQVPRARGGRTPDAEPPGERAPPKT